MKIIESNVNMASSREYQETDREYTERGIRWEAVLNDRMGEASPFSTEAEFRERLTIMRLEAMTVFNTQNAALAQNVIAAIEQQREMLNAIFEALFAGMSENESPLSIRSASFTAIRLSVSGERGLRATGPMEGISLRYTEHETTHRSHHEREDTRFTSGGTVKTADGREIDFNLGLKMAREFRLETTKTLVESGEVRLLDPLVINFDGNFAGLSDMTFDFDLDVDGEEEEIHGLLSGSGFLAFDRNADGTINDGSELFGATTDDGFGELAAYDEDGNNWIDENDAIFDQLSVWRKDGDTDYLYSLGEAGIGAIHLASADTMFSLTDEENRVKGQVEKTGIFLKEDGGAGTVQQLKFAAGPPTDIA